MAFDFLNPSQQAFGGVAHTRPWLLRIALLIAAVFIAHMALLNTASVQFNLGKSNPTAVFTTRTIEPPPVVPAVVTPPPVVKAVTKQPPAAKPKPTDRPTTPAPAALPPPRSLDTIETIAAPSQEPITPGSAAPAPEAAATPDEASPAPDKTAETASSASGLPPAAFTALSSAKHLYSVVFTKNTNANRGTAELTWRHDGDNYALSLLARYYSIPVFLQSSVGHLSPQGLLPTRFSDRKGLKSELAAHFDHAQGKLTFSANTPDAVLLAGAQDRSSIILQLAGLLAADPTKYPTNTTLSLQTVSAREAEMWLFTVNEPETLNLPAGPQIALRLTRNPRREFDQKIELWFAPALNYLPVRIRQTESNGDYFDAQWQSSQNLPDTMPR